MARCNFGTLTSFSDWLQPPRLRNRPGSPPFSPRLEYWSGGYIKKIQVDVLQGRDDALGQLVTISARNTMPVL